MSKERELLERVISGDDDGDFFISHRLYKDIETFLAQPEQTEHIKKKKEPEIYFVKDESATLKSTFKNPKETPFWIDVLHGGG